MTISRILHWIFFLMILIPLSVDNVWSLPIGHYHFRVQYLGAAGLAALFFTQSPRTITLSLQKYFAQGWIKFFLGMALVGAVGTFLSVHQSRAIYFLFWAMGTLIGVPFLVRYSRLTLGPVIFRLLTGYLLVQSLVIVCDFFLCFSTKAQHTIARVMTYDYVGGILVCRPHAWYQEPGYFCGFALIVLVLIRSILNRGSLDGAISKRFYLATYILGLLAVGLTLSRMGLLGVIALLVFEVGHFFAVKVGQKSPRSVAAPMSKTNWVIAGVLICILSVGLVRSWPALDGYIVSSLRDPGNDPSFENRYGRLLSSLQVFYKNPIVGAGPGAAGAYLVEKLPDSMFVRFQSDARKNSLKNDPFSLSLFSELLSEWGSLGFIFFSLAMIAILRALPGFTRWRLATILVIVYAATQTLARFDLWWAIASLMEFGFSPDFSGTSRDNSGK